MNLSSLTLNDVYYDHFPAIVDDTLSLPGVAADSEAVGEALRKLSESKSAVVAQEQTLIFADNSGLQTSSIVFVGPLVPGKTYTVVWGDKEFVCECYDKAEGNGMSVEGIALGNASLAFPAIPDTGEPFFVASSDGEIFNVIKSGEDPVTTIAIYAVNSVSWNDLADRPFYEKGSFVKKLDKKFLPEEVPPASIDLSEFESAGRIVETFPDGSTATTVVEFDDQGFPVRITDNAGNVTILNW